jgi:hypothetical protein
MSYNRGLSTAKNQQHELIGKGMIEIYSQYINQCLDPTHAQLHICKVNQVKKVCCFTDVTYYIRPLLEI